MSFSTPTTSKPVSTRWATDSEPTRPPEPVTVASGNSLLSMKVGRMVPHRSEVAASSQREFGGRTRARKADRSALRRVQETLELGQALGRADLVEALADLVARQPALAAESVKQISEVCRLVRRDLAGNVAGEDREAVVDPLEVSLGLRIAGHELAVEVGVASIPSILVPENGHQHWLPRRAKGVVHGREIDPQIGVPVEHRV